MAFPPHIVAREDRKTLDLLRFALVRHGLPARWDGERLDLLGRGGEGFVIAKRKGEWVVAYSERGDERLEGRFPNSYNAVRFLFWRLVRSSDLYDVREEWERETGQEFSLVD